jgi:hypothetical protein
MKTPLISILYFVLASLLGAAGQFLYREGAQRAGGAWVSYLLNARLALGVLCYVAVMVLFVAAFKRGGALTVLYPVYATTFIWAALIARAIDGQPVRPVNVAGMILLVTGMHLMGRQS